MDEFLAEVGSSAEPVADSPPGVELHFQWRPQVRDPGDELVLEAAINGDADALITYKVADFAEAAERFGIAVLRPGEVLKKVKR